MMKKILFFVLVFIFTNSLQGQQKVDRKLDTIVAQSNKNGISYKLILELGTSTGIERYYYKDQYVEELGVAYSWHGLSLTAINNISFKDKFLLGIGGGFEYRSLFVVIPDEIGATCFLNFRYYFNKPMRKVIPMLNIAIGARMVKEYDFLADKGERLSEMLYGVYSTFGAGFKVKRFSLQSGVLFWTKGYNLYGVDAMLKVGLTF